MSPELKRMIESKRAFRKQLAEKPVAEKLRIIEELAERSLATRKDTSAPLPEEPWQIPQNWRWSRMGEVATIVGGSTPRTDRADYFGGEVPWITPADLSGYKEKTISRGARNITQAGLENSGARLLPANTILFSSRAPIGYVAIAANPVATNQGFKSFVLGDELLPDFVYYYLQRAKEFAVALASGTTFLEISGKNAARLPIPIPPLAEQHRIVAEIEKQFTRLEAGVAALRRVQANLKRYRAAVLKAACEGRLVPTEAERLKAEGRGLKDFESGEQLLKRILTERRQNWQGRGQYKEPAVPDTASLPPLPEGWTWASAEQLTLLVTSGSRGWGEFYSDVGSLFIRAQDIKTDSLKLDGVARVTLPAKAEGMRSSVENRDLLITITGANVTKSAIVHGLSEVAFVSQHVALLKPVCREASSFQLVWIVSPAHGRKVLEKWAYGAGKPGLSLEQVRSLPIALPPLAEQTRIVAEVERRLSVVEELESVVTANLQRAIRLRQAILHRAFSGERPCG